MTVAIRQRRVGANGVDFALLEAGDGPLALCLHGFPDNAHGFEAMLGTLACAGFHAVAPFMRGYWPTSIPAEGRYATADLTDDALALIDALGEGPAVVIGHDWGALAALGAAIEHPDRVRRLVLIAANHPASNLGHDPQYLKGIWHVFFFQMAGAAEVFIQNDFQFAIDWMRDSSPNWTLPDAYVETVKRTLRRRGVAEAVIAYYRDAIRFAEDPRERHLSVTPVSVPTLALHGTADRPRRLACFEAMDPYFTGGLTKHVVDGTGHFMHLEAPDAVNALVVEFLIRN